MEFKNVIYMCVCVCAQLSDSVTPWTVVHHVPLSLGFSRQECWSGLPFFPPGALPNPGIKPMSPALASRFFTTEPPGKPVIYIFQLKKDLPGGPVIGISLPVKESWRIPGPGRFHGATKPMGHNC